MQKIYSHPDLAIVHLIKNELENRGIEAVIRGEHAAAVLGGGSGIEASNELWIVDEDRIQEAAQVIQNEIEHSPTEEGEPWTCPRCGEELEPQFAVCWKCGQERPGTVREES